MKWIEMTLSIMVLVAAIVWSASWIMTSLHKRYQVTGDPPVHINPHRVVGAWSTTVLLLCSGAQLYWFGSLLLASNSGWFSVVQIVTGVISARDAWVLTQKYRSWRAMKSLGVQV